MEETKVTLVAALAPNLTVAALVNPVPVMVTKVPPPLDPFVGEILVTTGTTTNVALIVCVATTFRNV